MKRYAKALMVLHEIENITDEWVDEEKDSEESMDEIIQLINKFLYTGEDKN